MTIIIRSNGRKYQLKENKNRFFFPEEYLKFESQLKPSQLHTIKCLLHTGARINEIRHVNPSIDINYDDCWILLKVTKTKAIKGERKGNARYIKISKQFAKYLKSYKNETYLGILSTPAINIAIKKAANVAGLQNPSDLSAHSLRKTLETWLMALGVNDLKILKHIGHDARTAVSNYISSDIFSVEQKMLMRQIIGDLYEK